MNAQTWRARLDRANAAHVLRLAHALRREFARLLRELKPTSPQTALIAHRSRLSLIIASEKRAAALTFGFLGLEMLAPESSANYAKSMQRKAEPLTRAERIGQVFLALARTMATGAEAVALAELLARDPMLAAAVEAAILTALDSKPAAVAATLLEAPRVRARVAAAHAIVTGADIALEAIAEAATGDPSAIGDGRNDTPPNEPPGGGAGGGDLPPRDPPPRRSRFSELVERMVREEAPVRARQIAAGSGNVIAEVLGQGAAQGWGEERLRKELEARLGAVVAQHRARRIARTELGAAQNQAMLALAQDRAAAGEKLTKVWVAIDDGRTRPSHADADDQVRPIEQPFAVGVSSLMHPGDPSGPLNEIINCRCAMLIQSAPGPVD